jgi:hypothetical protein
MAEKSPPLPKPLVSTTPAFFFEAHPDFERILSAVYRVYLSRHANKIGDGLRITPMATPDGTIRTIFVRMTLRADSIDEGQALAAEFLSLCHKSGLQDDESPD